MKNIKEIQELLKTMSKSERLELIRLCNIENSKANTAEIYLKLANNYRCPFCESNHVVKNGTNSGKTPKFICKNCHKNYSIRTKTIFQGTHKSIEVWQEYIELFSQGKSLPYISKTMKINIKTAFYWRHKILKVLQKKNDDDNNKLGGIVEADETFFEENKLAF